MKEESEGTSPRTRAVFARLVSFCCPDGEAAARAILGAEYTEAGQMRMSPETRWIPFIAQETIGATRTRFRWEARLDPSKMMGATVRDEYDGSRGRTTMKIGILPVRRITGPEADAAELQRYLASAVLCPSMLLNNPALKFDAIGPNTLNLCDRGNPTAEVDLDVSENGQPLSCWALRPRMLGRKMVWERWSATGADFREWEGLRIPFQMEAKWHLHEGEFAYFRSVVKSIRKPTHPNA